MDAIAVTAEILSSNQVVKVTGFDPVIAQVRILPRQPAFARISNVYSRAPASSSPIVNWKLVGRAVLHLKKGDRSQ